MKFIQVFSVFCLASASICLGGTVPPLKSPVEDCDETDECNVVLVIECIRLSKEEPCLALDHSDDGDRYRDAARDDVSAQQFEITYTICNRGDQALYLPDSTVHAFYNFVELSVSKVSTSADELRPGECKLLISVRSNKSEGHISVASLEFSATESEYSCGCRSRKTLSFVFDDAQEKMDIAHNQRRSRKGGRKLTKASSKDFKSIKSDPKDTKSTKSSLKAESGKANLHTKSTKSSSKSKSGKSNLQAKITKSSPKAKSGKSNLQAKITKSSPKAKSGKSNLQAKITTSSPKSTSPTTKITTNPSPSPSHPPSREPIAIDHFLSSAVKMTGDFLNEYDTLSFDSGWGKGINLLNWHVSLSSQETIIEFEFPPDLCFKSVEEKLMIESIVDSFSAMQTKVNGVDGAVLSIPTSTIEDILPADCIINTSITVVVPISVSRLCIESECFPVTCQVLNYISDNCASRNMGFVPSNTEVLFGSNTDCTIDPPAGWIAWVEEQLLVPETTQELIGAETLYFDDPDKDCLGNIIEFYDLDLSSLFYDPTLLTFESLTKKRSEIIFSGLSWAISYERERIELHWNDAFYEDPDEVQESIYYEIFVSRGAYDFASLNGTIREISPTVFDLRDTFDRNIEESSLFYFQTTETTFILNDLENDIAYSILVVASSEGNTSSTNRLGTSVTVQNDDSIKKAGVTYVGEFEASDSLEIFLIDNQLQMIGNDVVDFVIPTDSYISGTLSSGDQFFVRVKYAVSQTDMELYLAVEPASLSDIFEYVSFSLTFNPYVAQDNTVSRRLEADDTFRKDILDITETIDIPVNKTGLPGTEPVQYGNYKATMTLKQSVYIRVNCKSKDGSSFRSGFQLFEVQGGQEISAELTQTFSLFGSFEKSKDDLRLTLLKLKGIDFSFPIAGIPALFGTLHPRVILDPSFNLKGRIDVTTTTTLHKHSGVSLKYEKNEWSTNAIEPIQANKNQSPTTGKCEIEANFLASVDIKIELDINFYETFFTKEGLFGVVIGLGAGATFEASAKLDSDIVQLGLEFTKFDLMWYLFADISASLILLGEYEAERLTIGPYPILSLPSAGFTKTPFMCEIRQCDVLVSLLANAENADGFFPNISHEYEDTKWSLITPSDDSISEWVVEKRHVKQSGIRTAYLVYPNGCNETTIPLPQGTIYLQSSPKLPYIRNVIHDSADVTTLSSLYDNTGESILISDCKTTSTFGTDPKNSDTNDDLIDDGFENSKGLLSNTPHDKMSDEDGDGLGLLQEQILGTNPFLQDSDNDGYTDFEEFNAGTDPNNKFSSPSIVGEDTGTVNITLSIGDYSGSHSERYIMQVGPFSHQAHQFGVVETAVYKFSPGDYTITVQHIDSNLDTPDYDYYAAIQYNYNDPEFDITVSDPNNLLGYHSESINDYTIGKFAQLSIRRKSTVLGCDIYDSCQDCNAKESCSWDTKMKYCRLHTVTSLSWSKPSVDDCACSKCHEWESQNKDISWIDALPICPCTVEEIDVDGIKIIKVKDDQIQTHYPSITWIMDPSCNSYSGCGDITDTLGCILTEKNDNFDGGQRCCYDKSLNLRHSLPEKVHRQTSYIDHLLEYVLPFNWCCNECEDDESCSLYIGNDVRDCLSV